MKKVKQKVKNIKNKAKNSFERVASYKRHIVLITDHVMGVKFPVIVYALRNAQGSSLPAIKVVLPAADRLDPKIGEYVEFATLIKDQNDIWSKSADIEFNKKAQKILGVKGIVEEAQIGSLDVMIIAQVEEELAKSVNMAGMKKISVS